MSEEETILSYLATNDLIEDSYPWSVANQFDHKKVVGAIKSLWADDYIRLEDLSRSYYALTDQGTTVLENGSPEYVVYQSIQGAGKMSLEGLTGEIGADAAKIGMANCMKNKWIKKDGADLVPAAAPESVVDVVRLQLVDLIEKEGNLDALDEKVCMICSDLEFIWHHLEHGGGSRSRIKVPITFLHFMGWCDH